MTTTEASKRGRPPRRTATEGRVLWNGEPVAPNGDIIVQPDTKVVPEAAMTAPEEPEDDEDEDEVEDDEDDDEDEPLELAPAGGQPGRIMGGTVVAPPGRVPSFGPPPGRDIVPTQAELRQARADVEQTVAQKLEGYDLKSGEFSFTLMRVKPAMWKGKEIDGWVTAVDVVLTEPEVKAIYGGGSYRWNVYGPDPKNAGRKSLLKVLPFKISGDPIVQDLEEQAKNSDVGLLRDVMKQKNEEVERIRKDAEEARKTLEKKMDQIAARSESSSKEFLEMVLQIVNPKGAKDQALEERKLQELKAQAEREERRRESEAAERRHKEAMDAADRRFQQQLQESRQQHEKDMARMQQENLRAVEALKNSEKTTTSSLETMMKWQAQQSEQSMERQAKLALENEQRARDANNAMLAGLQSLQNTKEEFLLKMVDRKDEDPMEKMLKLKQFMDMFQPGEKPKDGWDRAFEAFEKVGPNVVPGIMAAISRGGGAVPAAPRFTPGTVAAVDLPSSAGQLPAPRRKKRRPRPQTATGKPTTNQVTPVAGPEGVASGHYPSPAPPPVPADALDWAPVFPTDEITDPEAVIKILIGNLEQAAQHDWTTEKIFTDIVKKFPAPILELLKLATVDKAVETVVGGVPEDWVLKSIRGRALVSDLMTMLLNGV